MKVIKGIWNAITTVLVALVVILAIALVGVRLVGFQVFTVLSGSMEPTYHVGSLIYVRQIDEEDIEVGTPITFRVSDGTLVATHRVHEIIAEDGERLYITKGDANDVTDPPLKYGNVVGSPVFSIPFLGYYSSWLQSGAGVIAGIALAAVLLLTTLLTELLPSAEKPTQSSNPQAQSAPNLVDPLEPKENQ